MNISTTKYSGIFQGYLGNKRFLFTKSLDGKTFFGERMNKGYRQFDFTRSKLAAAVMKNVSEIPIRENNSILYLGASHGYTPSFVSDMIGRNGSLYCVEFAPRVIRDLIEICGERENMAPILANANHPELYKDIIKKVDVIYQDIAQKNQVEILFKNLQFLKPKGYVLLAIKSRSIDVTKKPFLIFDEVKIMLKTKLNIIDFRTLDPFEKDHIFFVCQLK